MTDAQVNRQIELLSAETERQIATAYSASRERIRSYMAKLYEKYAIDGELTYAEMAKYNRLDSLNLFLADEMKLLAREVETLTKKLVSDAYQKAYYEYGAIISDQAGTSLNFGVVNRDTIASLINTPYVSGLSLLETLTANRYNALLRERGAITQGMINGDGFVDMARRLKEQFDKSFNDTLRIVRTEGTRASGEGQATAYDRADELGIDLVRIWVSSKDDRTRQSHRELNGKQSDKEGYFHKEGLKARFPGGWGEASMDVNCRCRIIAEVKE